jgi:hypothetical protein
MSKANLLARLCEFFAFRLESGLVRPRGGTSALSKRAVTAGRKGNRTAFFLKQLDSFLRRCV